MGFNTQVLIRNADLDEIAADPEFGQTLASTVLSADMVAHKKRQSGAPGPVTNHDMSDRRDLPRKAYEFQVNPSQHASGEMISVIHEGQLLATSFSQGGWHAMTALAECMTRFGYRSARKGTGFIAEADLLQGIDNPATEAEWMRGWSDDAYRTASTAITVLNDGLDDIRKTDDLGRRLSDAIRRWWAQERHIHEMERAPGGEVMRNMRAQQDVSLPRFSNCVSIAGTALEGQTEIFVTGGNWGRMLRPFLDRRLRQDDSDHLKNLRDRDIERCIGDLAMSGFMIRRPGRQRSESPHGWNEKNWVSPPAEEPAGPEGP